MVSLGGTWGHKVDGTWYRTTYDKRYRVTLVAWVTHE